jgi:hypothetical protein
MSKRKNQDAPLALAAHTIFVVNVPARLSSTGKRLNRKPLLSARR